jgi:putative FmdB family regulatory protein
MPIYDYRCTCGWSGELMLPVEYRDQGFCPNCLRRAERQLAAPMGRMAGRVVQGGGPDRYTADMLGIPLKELPAGLRSGRKSVDSSK